MPNIKSAIKRVQVTQTKTLKNTMIKSALKTYIRRFDEAIKAGDNEKLQAAFVKATKNIDKAAAKGILHKNTASRKKSLIARKMNQANA